MVVGLASIVAAVAQGVAALPVAADPVVDNSSHLYSLDGWGGMHPQGSSPSLSTNGYWYGWDIARGMSLFADGSGGYTLDGWGGIHNVGSAPPIGDDAHAYFGWDIARGIQLAPWATPANPAGWTLDGWGGIHPFGGAPAVADGAHAYWANWDIARGFVVFPDTALGTVRGYILDGWGGLHGFAGGGAIRPLDPQSTGYWWGWDIARSIALLPQSHTGYVLDGWGGLHGFAPRGQALPLGQQTAYWSGWDIARSVTTWTGASPGTPGGWTMDGWGGFHAFGSAPPVGRAAYWYGWDIARSSSGAGSGSSGRPPAPRARTLAVPWFRQAYNLSCEEAALQMALAWEGINTTQGDLFNTIGIDYRAASRDGGGNFHWGDPYASFVGDPNGSESNLTGYGTYYSTIARAAQQLGGQVLAAGEGYSPANVYGSILDGHPVVAWVSFDYAPHQNSYYTAFDGRVVQFGAPYEHAVTVIGVNPTSVLLNDPWHGQIWVPRSTFETAYAVFNDMAVVLG